MTYTVTTDQGIFEMTAPLHVIVEAYRLHRNAVARIVQEAKTPEGCYVCFNGKHPRLTGITVKKEGGAACSAASYSKDRSDRFLSGISRSTKSSRTSGPAGSRFGRNGETAKKF